MKATDFKKRLNGTKEFSVRPAYSVDYLNRTVIFYLTELDAAGDRTGRKLRMTLTPEEVIQMATSLCDMANAATRK